MEAAALCNGRGDAARSRCAGAWARRPQARTVCAWSAGTATSPSRAWTWSFRWTRWRRAAAHWRRVDAARPTPSPRVRAALPCVPGAATCVRLSNVCVCEQALGRRARLRAGAARRPRARPGRAPTSAGSAVTRRRASSSMPRRRARPTPRGSRARGGAGAAGAARWVRPWRCRRSHRRPALPGRPSCSGCRRSCRGAGALGALPSSDGCQLLIFTCEVPNGDAKMPLMSG